MSNCYSSCVVTAIFEGTYNYYVGGIVGKSSAGSISNCYATGAASISENGQTKGRAGLLGDNSDGGTIRTCYATGGNGLTYNATYYPDGRPRLQGTLINSYYPVGQLGNSDGGSAISAGATRANFVDFDFDNVWIWTDGQWPKLRNVPGTQPTVSLPQ